MMNNKFLIVGGTWDYNGGKESGYFKKFYEELKEYTSDITYYNGGNFKNLEDVIKLSKDYGAVVWFAYVDNSLPKLTSVKEINPYTILVGSKRNDNSKYSFVDVLNRALLKRHNLSVEFSKKGDVYNALLFDTLGAKWYEGTEIKKLVEVLYKRIMFLSNVKRKHTFQVKGNVQTPDIVDFFKFVRKSAEVFHKTIDHSDGVTRFMGNASFREDKKYIFVSKRDIDKSTISRDSFVACKLDSGKLHYYGDTKPSKDAITQANLYNLFPNINYMIHSHCYVLDGEYTEMPVPCGSLDEIDQVKKVIDRYHNGDYTLKSYRINYLGHGCLLLGNSVEDLEKAQFIARNFPEELPNTEGILNLGMEYNSNTKSLQKVKKH